MEHKMEHKYLFGSKLLQLNNCRDEDWLIFVNKRGADIKEKGHRSISCYNTILNRFVMGKNEAKDIFKSFYLYQLSAPFIDKEDYLFNFFNILEHRRVWITQLKGYINLEKTEQLSQKGDVLPKQFYHLAYQYYMLVEDAHWISDEAKEIVQKIHDYEMPTSYFYELKELINSL